MLFRSASGGDGIPVELFQILKDDAVKVLQSVCQQIWKTQQWPQDWKTSSSPVLGHWSSWFLGLWTLTKQSTTAFPSPQAFEFGLDLYHWLSWS